MSIDKEALRADFLEQVNDIAWLAREGNWPTYNKAWATLEDMLDQLLALIPDEPQGSKTTLDNDALEQACIDIAALVEDRGKLLTVRPTKLILIPDQAKE